MRNARVVLGKLDRATTSTPDVHRIDIFATDYLIILRLRCRRLKMQRQIHQNPYSISQDVASNPRSLV